MTKPPPDRFHYLFIIVFILMYICISLSCSDSVPQIIQTDVNVIFDYSDENSAPSMHLSVFVQSDSDVRRVGNIVIENVSTGYQWGITSPEIIASADTEWAGYADLEPRDTEPIPQGSYKLEYTDSYGRKVETEFSVIYNKELVDSTSADIAKLLGIGYESKIAVYTATHELVYFGKRKKEWKNNDAVFKDFKDASYMRICAVSSTDNTVCMLPIHVKPGEEVDITAVPGKNK